MKKHIKYFLRILLIIITLIFVSTLLINKIYGEKIQEKITAKLSKQVNTKIESSRITLSLIRDFPAASIKVEDLVVFEANGFSDDTLIYAQNMGLSFNIADLIRKKYIINNIYFDGGKIDVKYDVDNNSNFNFLKNDTSKSLIINSINLENINNKYVTSGIIKNV